MLRSTTARVALAASVVGSLLVLSPGAQARSVQPGCDADRRSVVHAGGKAVAARGSWEPCLLDTGFHTGETNMGIMPDGTLIRSTATDRGALMDTVVDRLFGDTTNTPGIAVSSNRGASWVKRLLPKGTPPGVVEGYADPQTGRYFMPSDTVMNYTDDAGRTWHTGTFDSADRYDWPRSFAGRPVKLRKTGYRNNVYHCNWTSAAGANTDTRCYRSVDGGRTFHNVGPDFVHAQCSNPLQVAGVTHGRGIVDARNGTIYLPFHECGTFYVAVSTDEGQSWTRRPVATFTSTAVNAIADTALDVPFVLQNATGRPNAISGEMQAGAQVDAVAMDSRGRLVAVWIDGPGYRTYLARSADGGRTWTKRLDITAPGVSKAILPSVDISRRGRIGVSYYGTTTGGETWTGFLAVSDDAKTFQSAAVTRPGKDLMQEPCCWASTTVENTTAKWGPDGSLYGAFARSSREDGNSGVVGRLRPVS